MTMSKYDIDNISDILSGKGDWFNANLLRLIAQADEDNLQRLASAFPEAFIYYMAFKYGGVPTRFARIRNVFAYMDELRERNTGPDWINLETGYHSRYIRLTSGSEIR